MGTSNATLMPSSFSCCSGDKNIGELKVENPSEDGKRPRILPVKKISDTPRKNFEHSAKKSNSERRKKLKFNT